MLPYLHFSLPPNSIISANILLPSCPSFQPEPWICFATNDRTTSCHPRPTPILNGFTLSSRPRTLQLKQWSRISYHWTYSNWAFHLSHHLSWTISSPHSGNSTALTVIGYGRSALLEVELGVLWPDSRALAAWLQICGNSSHSTKSQKPHPTLEVSPYLSFSLPRSSMFLANTLLPSCSSFQHKPWLVLQQMA